MKNNVYPRDYSTKSLETSYAGLVYETEQFHVNAVSEPLVRKCEICEMKLCFVFFFLYLATVFESRPRLWRVVAGRNQRIYFFDPGRKKI